jgi:general stress protein 26
MANYLEYVSEAKQLMSLATVSGEHPSVRIVGFGHDAAEPGMFYVVTKPDSVKEAEILENEHVAFITFPGTGGKRISTNQATAQVSEKEWAAIAPLFADNPGWHHGHPNPEDEVILEIKVNSILLESFIEAPEVITF